MPNADYQHECFLISPIGEPGSPVRERFDGIRDYIVKPAVEDLGLDFVVVRADDISQPGQITLDVIDHIANAPLAIADLTDLNPNVFYELAARHAANLPVVLIAHEDQLKAGLPFDLQQMRTISYDDNNLKKAAGARSKITEFLRAGLGGATDSPIAAALSLDALRAGDSTEQTLAELISRVSELSLFQRELNRKFDQQLGTRPATTVRERWEWEAEDSEGTYAMRISRLAVNPGLVHVSARRRDASVDFSIKDDDPFVLATVALEQIQQEEYAIVETEEHLNAAVDATARASTDAKPF